MIKLKTDEIIQIKVIKSYLLYAKINNLRENYSINTCIKQSMKI